MCPRQAQIPAVTDVKWELMWKSGLVLCMFLLFLGDSQGLLQAVVKISAALGLLQLWHQGYNVIFFVWAVYLLAVEKECYCIIKQNTNSFEAAQSWSNSRSRLQRIITVLLSLQIISNLQGNRLLPNLCLWTTIWNTEMKHTVREQIHSDEYKLSIWTLIQDTPCAGFKCFKWQLILLKKKWVMVSAKIYIIIFHQW